MKLGGASVGGSVEAGGVIGSFSDEGVNVGEVVVKGWRRNGVATVDSSRGDSASSLKGDSGNTFAFCLLRLKKRTVSTIAAISTTTAITTPTMTPTGLAFECVEVKGLVEAEDPAEDIGALGEGFEELLCVSWAKRWIDSSDKPCIRFWGETNRGIEYIQGCKLSPGKKLAYRRA